MVHIKPPQNFNPRFEIVSCFCKYNDSFLVLHRQDHKPEGDTWGVPAGKRDANEDLVEAIQRETYEETQIILSKKDIHYIDKVYVTYDSYHFVYHVFETTFESQPKVTIRPQEHKSYKWVTKQEALKMNLIQDEDRCIELFYKPASIEANIA